MHTAATGATDSVSPDTKYAESGTGTASTTGASLTDKVGNASYTATLKRTAHKDGVAATPTEERDS